MSGKEYVYAAVDETGNLGKSLKGERFYTLAACVVSNRRKFEDAVRRLGLPEEVKFHTHEHLRKAVLEYASPAVSDVFYVRYHKPIVPAGRFGQKSLHLDMVQALADAVALRCGSADRIEVEVDRKDGISDEKVRKLFEENEYRSGHITCEVLDSYASYGLQTNDFFVGAVGYALNRSDYSYVNLFQTDPRECYVRQRF